MTSLPKSNIPSPGLTALMTNLSRKTKLELNCIQVGSIQTFYPATCTADVQISMQYLSVQPDGNGGERLQPVNYPLIQQVPVQVMTGGSDLITMPIQSGDGCIILFNDRDLSNWQAGIIGRPPASKRVHAITDAIVIVGLHNSASPITGYEMRGPCISAPGSYVKGNLNVSTGATDTFVSADGATVTVVNGIVVNIAR
jgi:hypothetical protein